MSVIESRIRLTAPTDDVKDIFKRITGTDLVVENLKVQQPVEDDE